MQDWLTPAPSVGDQTQMYHTLHLLCPPSVPPQTVSRPIFVNLLGKLTPCFQIREKYNSQTTTKILHLGKRKLQINVAALDTFYWIFPSFPRQRPYHVEHTSSRPITEVKQR